MLEAKTEWTNEVEALEWQKDRGLDDALDFGLSSCCHILSYFYIIELFLHHLQYHIFLCHPIEASPSKDEQWLPSFSTSSSVFLFICLWYHLILLTVWLAHANLLRWPFVTSVLLVCFQSVTIPLLSSIMQPVWNQSVVAAFCFPWHTHFCKWHHWNHFELYSLDTWYYCWCFCV